jgi:hypothetical protein
MCSRIFVTPGNPLKLLLAQFGLNGVDLPEINNLAPTEAAPVVYRDGSSFASVLLKAMGQSEKSPGVLQDDNIKSAADRLRRYVQEIPEPEESVVTDEDDDEQTDEQEEPQVGLSIRAKPLLDMLDKAYKENADVIWR